MTLGAERVSVSVKRVLAGPATLATFAFLVVPFALGWLKSALFSPLALPGYVIYGISTAIGNAVAPRFKFWLYWAPFLAACYGIAVAVGFGYEWLRERAGANSSDGL